MQCLSAIAPSKQSLQTAPLKRIDQCTRGVQSLRAARSSFCAHGPDNQPRMRMPPTTKPRTSVGARAALLAVTLATVGLVGYLDYVSGAELRIFPLYYLPVS
jgi:hypothetical protein